MTQLTQANSGQASASTATLADRRRPGRVENVSPELIPLLRGEQALSPDDLVTDEPDQMSAARGLAAGVLLSAPLWAVVIYVARLAFH